MVLGLEEEVGQCEVEESEEETRPNVQDEMGFGKLLFEVEGLEG